MTNTKAGNSEKKPDAATLERDSGYLKILELDFSEMIPFVLANIRRPGIIPLLYMGINISFLVFIFLFTILSVKNASITGGRAFWQILAGILAGSILVIPPHELLHGLAYRILGARKISFGADFKQFIFYVTADRFPLSKKELIFLAMVPFVIINLVIIASAVTWASRYTLFSASLLLCHNIMCIGDFAVMSYAFSRKGRIFTFDDTEKKKSYFFEKQVQKD